MERKLTLDRSPRSGSAGFSLIELVVVVAIVAVLATGASLVAARSGDATALSDQQRFVRGLERTRARAIQGRQTLGIALGRGGLQIATRTQDGWQVSDRAVRWRNRVTVLRRADRTGPEAPDIVILPNGQVSEFTVSFGRNERSGRTTCRGTAEGMVTCDGA
ncbi:prepilin-type N-terminal cleavage/methylation domain-containing protein [uncultured Tateyamaria sp.]|uniref:prepilin-type N-terminal cleavage/methylation domain-containing protein n=1 Tax=uncultured Tateyamaria sp. TaxID=455651 RepID=UPI00260D8B25|nr:prepilin-type N-terminal cleavage/methylation domain-containing protein [uncultured Tateyamaria sp.]